MFCTRVAWVCLVCLQLCKRECSSPVSLELLTTEKKDMDLYEVPLFMSLLGRNRDYVNQFPYVWNYVDVKSSFKHTREECDFKKVYVF